VLAYCLEHTEGIGFSNGIAEPEEPAIAVRDLTGRVRVWIDIGSPDAARVHKASKAAPRVAIYTHKDPKKLLEEWTGKRIHRGPDVELYGFDRSMVEGLVARLERRMVFALLLTGEHLYINIGEVGIEGAVQRYALAPRAGDP